jgi:hypothetical protein
LLAVLAVLVEDQELALLVEQARQLQHHQEDGHTTTDQSLLYPNQVVLVVILLAARMAVELLLLTRLVEQHNSAPVRNILTFGLVELVLVPEVLVTVQTAVVEGQALVVLAVVVEMMHHWLMNLLLL